MKPRGILDAYTIFFRWFAFYYVWNGLRLMRFMYKFIIKTFVCWTAHIILRMARKKNCWSVSQYLNHIYSLFDNVTDMGFLKWIAKSIKMNRLHETVDTSHRTVTQFLFPSVRVSKRIEAESEFIFSIWFRCVWENDVGEVLDSNWVSYMNESKKKILAY